MLVLLIVVVLCHSLTVGRVRSEDVCNGLYSGFSRHLSSKTPYRFVANNDTAAVKFEGQYLLGALVLGVSLSNCMLFMRKTITVCCDF